VNTYSSTGLTTGAALLSPKIRGVHDEAGSRAGLRDGVDGGRTAFTDVPQVQKDDIRPEKTGDPGPLRWISGVSQHLKSAM
jgi:hypothetical protein